MDIIGYILICVGVLFIIVGLIGIFRFHNIYSRLLSAADVDTVGLVTILLGVVFIEGASWFSLKVLIIIGLILILNPIVSASIASSAYFSGYKLKKEDEEDE